MSQQRRDDHGNYDSLYVIEPDPDRLEQANHLHMSQLAAYDDINNGSITGYYDYKQPGNDSQTGDVEKSKSDVRSLDSGYVSLLGGRKDVDTIPMTDHMLDSVPDAEPCPPYSIPPKPLLSHLIAKDPGYSSLQSADFSSIGSSFSGDSGFVNDNLSASNASHTTTTSSNQSLSREMLRDFAQKMDYTDAEFEQCYADLGEAGVDKDKLLRHLVKLRDSAKGAADKKSPNVRSKSGPNSSSKKSQCIGDSKGLRRMVIDGSNVAMEHGLHQVYSYRGIELAVKYFQNRGHEHITVFVPAHKLTNEKYQTKDQQILRDLSRRGVLVKTPSRKSNKGNIASYEDRFVLKLASVGEAIVVSNDHFRDLKNESSAFRETIEKRILPFVFAGDQFIPAEDPLGRRGPTLEQFLRVSPHVVSSGMCPYGRKCTYGTKCRYEHPERSDTFDSAIGDCNTVPQSPSSAAMLADSGFTDNLPSSAASTSAGHRQDIWSNRATAMVNQSVSQYHSPNTFPYLMNSHATSHSSPSPVPTNYYISAYNGAVPSFAVDHPPVRISHPPLASRACQHVIRDKSYRSVPLDDPQYYSRQPIFNSQSMSSSAVSSHLASPLRHDVTSLASDLSTHVTLSSDSQTAAPLPLDETVNGTVSQQSTLVVEGRVQQALQHPKKSYDREILETDPRYRIYYHLKNLFPEPIVRRVMNRNPTELDPNKITAEVLQYNNNHKNQDPKANKCE